MVNGDFLIIQMNSNFVSMKAAKSKGHVIVQNQYNWARETTDKTGSKTVKHKVRPNLGFLILEPGLQCWIMKHQLGLIEMEQYWSDLYRE